jgi:hypothetical protein
MGRMKDVWIRMQENMSSQEEEELIAEQRKLDDYIENCIEEEKLKKKGVRL